MATEFKRIQLRRGVASEWTTANTVLALGEIGYETDSKKFKIGDGTTIWSSLPYFINTTDINTLISTAVAALVDQSPSTLDTLNELAAALGDDPEFATTITELIGTKADGDHTHPDFTDIDSVEITDLQSGQVLVYSPNSQGKWVNQTLSTSYALEDLTNTNITSPAPGALLQYDGQASEWVDAANLNNPVFTGEVNIGSDVNNVNVTISGITGSVNAGSITSTGEITAKTFTGIVAPTTATLDFSTETFKTITLTGTTTFDGSNYAAGRTVTVRVNPGTNPRTVGFPSGWVFVGTKPTTIAASKIGILTVTSFGTTAADCIAAWAVQS